MRENFYRSSQRTWPKGPGGSDATYFLRERVSHEDVILISWGLSDEICDVNRFGGTGLVLQTLKALAHFITINLDLDLTRECNVDIEGIQTEGRSSGAVEHDAQSGVGFDGCASGFAELDRLV